MTMNESCKVELGFPDTQFIISSLETEISKTNATLLIIVGFGGLSIIVSLLHNALHRYVYKDSHDLDTVFDAGGQVTTSLTAVTVVSQLLWPADFLQTAIVTTKTGIGGSFYFLNCATLIILFFPVLSLQMKTKAPGAKTFLQIVSARFGKTAHILYCTIALVTNMVILTSMILSGKYAMEILVPDMSTEFVVLIIAFLFGSYCYVGGLGTTFYISYFNTALIFISLIVYTSKIMYASSDGISNFTNINAMYEAVKCVKGLDGNFNNSLLTFRSVPGAVFGIALLSMGSAVICCDQATWQSRIASKPEQGVRGFFIAAFLYFCIPTCISVPSALSYLTLSYQNQSHLLSAVDVENGFITPLMMGRVLGSTGGYLLITMIVMALMATGSGEVMAISSIIVYDIYKVYIHPFRKKLSTLICPLCGERKTTNSKLCSCIPCSECNDCVEDIRLRTHNKTSYSFHYLCKTHGQYRSYEDMLLRYKNWCIMWTTLFIIPYGLLITSLKINLTWAVFTLQTLLSPFLFPLLLTISWGKCSAVGIISGTTLGSVSSIAAMLIVGATAYESGLNDFFITTSSEYCLLGACISGFTVSIVVTVIVSLKTTKVRSQEDERNEWMKTFSIDNPLHSWRELYRDELKDVPKGKVLSPLDMEVIFRKSRKLAYIGGSVIAFVLIFILPIIMVQYEEFNAHQLAVWMKFFFAILVVGALYALVAPPVEEYLKIRDFISRQNVRLIKQCAKSEEKQESLNLL